MSTRRARRLAATLAAALGAAIVAPAPAARAQQKVSGLSWEQRFLGIVPLVKPDPKDPVVVTVNGTPITAAQVQEYAKTEQRMVNATSTEEIKAVYKDATENLIGRQLLLDEAARRKIAIPDAQVAERAREFQVANLRGESVPPQSSAPDAQLMDAVRGSMMIEKMLDDEFRAHSVRPTDLQIRKYYDEHKDLFVKDPGEVQIAHVAVRLPQNANNEQQKAARDEIERLYAQAAKAKDFAAFARKYSQDEKSAPKGGDLGYFRPGQLPPTVDKLVFATPVGRLTPIIESNIGYSFIKVTARRGTTYSTLAEVKPKIAMVILDYNQDAVVKELLKQLAHKAKIQFKRRETTAFAEPRGDVSLG
jgi:parvulin-like peptidyl-prolyl isomerase